MKRAILLPLLLLAVAAGSPGGEKPRVSRAALSAMEKSFDDRIERTQLANPFFLLGATRGIYLEGYGAVFSAELNLITTPVLTPFHPTIPREEVEKVRRMKLERLTLLKQMMRDMLVAAAASLDTVPPHEKIAVAVSLFYHTSWEDTTGLPSQILMQAQRQILLDYQAARINEDALRASLRVQEF